MQCALRYSGHMEQRDYYHYVWCSILFFCCFLQRESALAEQSRVNPGTNVYGDVVFFPFFLPDGHYEATGVFCPPSLRSQTWRPRWTVDYNIDSKKVVYIYLKSHLLFECLQSVSSLSLSLLLQVYKRMMEEKNIGFLLANKGNVYTKTHHPCVSDI